MAQKPASLQPNQSELLSRDFTGAITREVTTAIAEYIANSLTDSGLIASAVDAVITRHRSAAEARARE